MSTNLSEEQLHEHPDFKALLVLVDEVEAHFSAQGGDGSACEAFIERVINNEVIAHMAGHVVQEVGPRYLPGPLFSLGALGMIRIWLAGFLVGAKFQGMRDADLASIEVPDFFPADLGSTSAEPHVSAEPEEVQAVQELPQEERRNLFKSMLRKPPTTDSTD